MKGNENWSRPKSLPERDPTGNSLLEELPHHSASRTLAIRFSCSAIHRKGGCIHTFTHSLRIPNPYFRHTVKGEHLALHFLRFGWIVDHDFETPGPSWNMAWSLSIVGTTRFRKEQPTVVTESSQTLKSFLAGHSGEETQEKAAQHRIDGKAEEPCYFACSP